MSDRAYVGELKLADLISEDGKIMDRSQVFMSVVQRAGTGYQNNLPKWQAELTQVFCKNVPGRDEVLGRS